MFNKVTTTLQEVRETLMNIRELNYLAFLRDEVTGFAKTNRDRIQILNSSAVHGGDALLDAERLQELRYDKHPCILRVLNAVGYAHLSGKMALREEKLETTFDEAVKLMERGEFGEAERLASELSPSDFAYEE